MQLVADLHIHSKYSRACSPQLTIPNIAKACETKGIDLVSTGDFTHPLWFKHIKEELEETAPGFYKINPARGGASNSPTKFILGTEVACIYKKNDKVRRSHLCLFAPNINAVEKIIQQLSAKGGSAFGGKSCNFNLASDGRPILGIDAKNLLELLLEIDENIHMIPAHAWTPWFSIFGSKSGFDSIEECFEELSSRIFSIETGLSSDPPMNWRLSALDKITLISNSDAHSLDNLGREANVFEVNSNFNYPELFKIIKSGDKKKFLYTIEFYPEKGKYHIDGHRLCGISLEPKETKKHKGICPVCKKPLTIGVLHRVDDLADRNEPAPTNKIPYKNLVPLRTIISATLGVGEKSKKVENQYQNIIKLGGNEFNILLNLSTAEISKISSPQIAEAIKRVRSGKIKVIPGFDGEYGKVEIFSKEELKQSTQKSFL